jgi:hypothetical protein
MDDNTHAAACRAALKTLVDAMKMAKEAGLNVTLIYEENHFAGNKLEVYSAERIEKYIRVSVSRTL